MKVNTYYKVTYGDWCRGTHKIFDTYKEAKTEYNEIKTELWGTMEVITESKKLFQKTKYNRETLESFNKWDEEE